MDRVEQAMEQVTKAFIAVRDELFNTKHMQAYRMSYKKPFRFYREHSKEEAVNILKAEAQELMRKSDLTQIKYSIT